jgi:hypothetical protein
MDKEQATNFILNALQENQKQEEIVANLSQQLKAPPELVARFVNQVKTKHADSIPPTYKIYPDAVRPSQPEESPTPSLGDSELTPSTATEYSQATVASSIAEQTPDSIEPSAHQPEIQQTPSPYPESDEIEQSLIEEVEQDGFDPDDTSSGEPAEITPTKEVDIEALTNYVVKDLGKHRRYSDVVGEICQRTGWSWNQAQRFVARIQTEHHGELHKKKNRLQIPIGIAFVIGGLFLLIYTGLELLNYLMIPMGMSEQEMLGVDFIPYLAALFILGFGLLVGGGFGLYRTFTS